MKRLIVLLVLAFLMGSRSGHCQQSAVGVFSVVVDEPLPLVEVQDKPIVIHLTERAKFPKSFHVRLFRGTPESLIAQARAKRDGRGCVKFFTAVLPVTARGSIQFQSLDKTWLKDTGTSLETEEYTLVFESGDQPSDRIIWLHEAELETYFRYGLRMQLHPNGTPFSEEVAATVRRQMVQQSQELSKVTNSMCWTARDLPESDLAKRKTTDRFLVARITASECDTAPSGTALTEVRDLGISPPGLHSSWQWQTGKSSPTTQRKRLPGEFYE